MSFISSKDTAVESMRKSRVTLCRADYADNALLGKLPIVHQDRYLIVVEVDSNRLIDLCDVLFRTTFIEIC